MATQIVELSGDEAKLFRALDRVIQKEADHRKSLQKVGDEGAEAGRKMEGSLDRVGKSNERTSKKATRDWDRFSKDSTGSFEGFSKKAIASIGGVATAFVSVTEGVNLLRDYLTAANELYDSARDKQISLAAAQQEALKNLAGLSESQRLGLIEEVPEIARQTGFRDLGALTSAVGAAVSAGADKTAAESAVRAAALLTPNKTDAVDDLAAAAIDLAAATGRTDARENLGFLTLVGTQARVVDPLALAQNVAPALANAVQSVPNQDPAEAARQAATIFTALSKRTTDDTGQKTRTASDQLFTEMSRFFGGLEQQRIDARSRVDLIDRATSPTEAQQVERSRLRAFLQASEGLTDPATIYGRFKVLQENEAINQQFFSREFGQSAFKDAYKELGASGSSLAASVQASYPIVQISKEAFDKQVKGISGATGALRLASLASGFDTATEVGQATNELAGLRSLVREQAGQQLKETRGTDVIGGTIESLTREFGVSGDGYLPRNLIGESVAAEATDAMSRMIERQRYLALDGITPEERPRFEQTASAIALFRDAVIDAVRLDPDSAGEANAFLRVIEQRSSSPYLFNESGEIQQVQKAEFYRGLRSEITSTIGNEVASAFTSVMKEFLGELTASRKANERSAEANEATAAAATATAENTQPGPTSPPDYGNIQRGRQQ